MRGAHCEIFGSAKELNEYMKSDFADMKFNCMNCPKVRLPLGQKIPIPRIEK